MTGAHDNELMLRRRPTYTDFCPICGCEDLVGSREDDRWVVRCGECGHIIGDDEAVKR
jgi:uncharacterized Zn finger protein